MTAQAMKTLPSSASATDNEIIDSLISCVIQQLKQLREESDLSRYRVAKLTGLHPSTIGLIERGQRSPSLFVLLKIAAEADLGTIIAACEAERSQPVAEKSGAALKNG